MSNKTKIITYNLADRGRKYNGVDRSDLDIRSMVNQINSPATQELVESGDLYGYNGHEIRARFGMNPPDKYVNPTTGTVINIEPAIRTIKLSADGDGNVTTQHEFIDTNDGRYAHKLYKANAGGFSSAINRRRGKNGLYEVTGFYGYDYVRQPNYNTNKGHGLFDSLRAGMFDESMCFDAMNPEELTPEQIILQEALDLVIASQYDSIQTALQAEGLVQHYQGEALAAQDALISSHENQAKRRQRIEKRKIEVFDSMICPSVPFDKALEEWNSFDSMGTDDNDLQTIDSIKKTDDEYAKADNRPRLFRH
ncbi:hypothetical protein [Psychrobacter sp. I-STPA10]|uniref:hypothetical protein n=1 Tax=Psychrobacter sp. I-STPA10 TaxID=2585769 RepID=UPI001E46B479|nr:hypothetical protein [Psychrobacter sp. I-STPA10]